MVGTNGTPDFEVTLADNFQNIMEEHGSTIMFMFFFGIFIGIFISYVFYRIYKFIKSYKTDNTASEAKPEECVIEQKVYTTDNDNKEDMIGIIVFILVIALVAVCAVCVAVGISNKDDKQDETSITETRDANNKDIIINVNNMTLSIQSSEKIVGLVVKVNYLDKDKNILKTEKVNVGNIAPGNTFQHTLTKSGMQVPDIDKFKSVTVDVIDGTIEE